jgi:hypothetical protein
MKRFNHFLKRFAQFAILAALLTTAHGSLTTASAADLSITASNVVAGADAITANGTAGATITAGQAVYLDTTTTTYKLAHASTNSSTPKAAGIALNAATANQPLVICTGGTLTIGAGTVGKIYVVSANNAGGVAPSSDLTTGWYTTILGVVTASNTLTVKINVSGAVN